MLALHPHAVQFAICKAWCRGRSCFADDDANTVLFRQSLEPRAEIYDVAHDGVGDAELRPHVADIHDATRDADPDSDRRPAAFAECVLEAGYRIDHAQSGSDGVVRMFVVVEWGAPKSHDRIAHVLVYGAAMLLDDAGDRCQEFVHEPCQLARIEIFRKSCEAAHVGEQHGHVAAVAFERGFFATGIEFRDQARRNVLTENAGQVPLVA